jgi:threonyl-tRNA synthetase
MFWRGIFFWKPWFVENELMKTSSKLMPVITLPDGTQKSFESPVTVAQVAASIGAGLAKAAIAGSVDGKLVDTFHTIDHDTNIRIITDRDTEGLEIIRHSTAHLLAHAVKTLFPQAQVTIGPVIENGFYYDFAYDKPFTEEDLVEIEKMMQKLATNNETVSRRTVGRAEAIKYFKSIGEDYKVKIIEDLPESETLTIYQQGDFADLCRGPHVPTTGMLKAFKLTKVSGAYWRGDSNNAMLQRIYGTAWKDKKALDEYLKNLEEAEKRDHRKLGKTMDLFHFQEEAPGMVFWHANGWAIYRSIRDYISKLITQDGYDELVTPQIVDLELWKKSGHWSNYGSNMFTIEADHKEYAIKPMSCPCHIMVYKQGLTSYRELPIRLAEFGCVHRNEMTGAMHGLMRVRQFTQDDGHIFCTEQQIHAEAAQFIRTTLAAYRDFGFEDVVIKLATRPENRIGSDDLWDNAETSLARALKTCGLKYEVLAGEGAFYGPKVEFHLKDCLGRMWQCGTLQLDYAMPARLEAYYIAEDGSKKTPVMLHRAILGSLERFIGIMLEQYAGKMPVWLAPVQAVIMNITDKQADFAQEVTTKLKKHGLRVKSDLRNEKIGFKIREHTIEHVPYLLVIGDREVESRSISVRSQDGSDLGSMSIDQFNDFMSAEIERRGRTK